MCEKSHTLEKSPTHNKATQVVVKILGAMAADGEARGGGPRGAGAKGGGGAGASVGDAASTQVALPACPSYINLQDPREKPSLALAHVYHVCSSNVL